MEKTEPGVVNEKKSETGEVVEESSVKNMGEHDQSTGTSKTECRVSTPRKPEQDPTRESRRYNL
ncbi:unnamed protein product [Thelazia callipaeda]|uniref:Hva1_TUDOR domain-containing protein n=1 Tax=Thelazia callipaeda TaxID=103827 RepID=A0A0N5CQI0_THECL|nr:unnamed protein product [Thelazia callipaeda]